jgi:hypothetical protein
MPNFSIITVSKIHQDGKIDGSWLQDHCAGTLKSAHEVAVSTSKINSGMLLAVTKEQVFGCQFSPLLWDKTPLIFSNQTIEV